jgi:hypothetical protein
VTGASEARGGGLPARAFLAPVVIVALVLGSLWYGHAPPRTLGAYEQQASLTAGRLHSQLETTRLWALELRRGRVTTRALVVAVQEAEDDAGVTLGRFAGYDPPPGGDPIRARLMGLGSTAVEMLARMRIAAARGDWDAVVTSAERARHLSTALERASLEGGPR